MYHSSSLFLHTFLNSLEGKLANHITIVFTAPFRFPTILVNPSELPSFNISHLPFAA
jgi:hypothetical protein